MAPAARTSSRRPNRKKKSQQWWSSTQLLYGLGALLAVLFAFWLGSRDDALPSNAVVPERHNSRDIVERQVSLNAGSADNWKLFEGHRKQVMGLILDAAKAVHASKGKKANLSLAVWGAGNCNDVVLPELLTNFHDIVLVDLDKAALEHALLRQNVVGAVRDRVHLRGNTDVSGLFGRLQSWRGFSRKPPATEVEAALAELKAPVDEWLYEHAFVRSTTAESGVDVSVSICILSQLMDSLTEVVDDKDVKTVHSSFLPLMINIRNRHLETVVKSLKPNGVGIIVVDFVADSTLKGLRYTNANDTGGLAIMAQIAEGDGNFFHGTKRRALLEAFNDPQIAPHVSDVHLVDPWKWTLSSNRQYLVYALVFKRV